MRCNLKRCVSLVLVFVMVLTMLPVRARAEECAHENLRSHGGTAEYIPLDGTYHTVLYHHYYICNDCGSGVWGETTSSKEYHNIFYLDNYCMDCGYRPGSTHTHNYSTSSTETKYVKLDDSYHNVVTTTTTKCSCGASGETSTSTVKEAHTFGEAKEVSSGNWQKTCTGCGATRKVEAPAQPGTSESTPAETKPAETTPPETKPTEPAPGETAPPQTHVHDFVYGLPEAEHPHYSYGYCSCGVGTTERERLLSCCQCTGDHTWGYPVRLPDGSFMQNCTKCDAAQTTTPTEGIKTYYKLIDMIKFRRGAAAKYQEEHGIDSATYAIWKTIAEQATDKLYTNDDDFVTTAETLETIRKGLLGIGWDALNYQSWDEQQTDCWKQLLMKMLEAENESDRISSEYDTVDSFVGFNANVIKVFENITGSEKDRLEELSGKLDANLDVLDEKLNQFADADPSDSALASTMKDKLETMQEAMKNRKTATDSSLEDKASWNDLLTDFGWMAQCTGYLLDGSEHYFLAREYRNALTSLNESADNVVILEEISKTAAAAGNTNLANAASELKTEIEESMVEALNEVVSLIEGLGIVLGEFIAFGFGFLAKEHLEGTIKTVSTAISNTTDILGLGALVMDIALGWGPVYDEAQTLMTLNQMDATMNILGVLKEKDDPYMAKLWGVLQTEGCLSAQKFLKKYNAANNLDLIDLGIDDGGLFGESELPDVMDELNAERDYYITALQLPLEKSK